MVGKNALSTSGFLVRRLMGLRLALATVAGILLADCLPLPPVVWLCVAVGLCVLLLIVVLFAKRSSRAGFVAPLLWLIWIAIGSLLPMLHAPSDPFPQMVGDSPHNFRVRLCDTPRPTPKCYKVVAEVLSLEGSPTRGKVLLYIRQDSVSALLRYGDCLSINARPKRPENWANENHFDYRLYLQRKGILWECYVPPYRWQKDVTPVTFSLRRWAKGLQLGMADILRHSRLTPRQQGIAEALLLGWRDDVDEPTQRQFRDAGITHLLCVSGLHVGIVAWLAGALLFFLGRKPWQRVLRRSVQMVAVWLFVLLTGMAPTTLRAGVMFSLLLMGDLLYRSPNTLNYLATSMLLLLLVEPMLLYDIGFQLSYAAVLGIVVWQRPLRRLVPALDEYGDRWYMWLPHKAWKLLCITTAAQVAALPLVLYHFHQFPLYFPIANLTVVPFAGVLLATALLVLLTSGMPLLCGWATALLRCQLEAVDGVTRWISSLPYAMLDGIPCNLTMALLLTVALLIITLMLHFHEAEALSPE
ncbi:MAG: ComEC family competence protein [Bacteroidales bacterium]|nr:ComEC family competence protein [Bacteroidales bacterium]